MARIKQRPVSPQARHARRIALSAIAGMRDECPVEAGCGDYTSAVITVLQKEGIRAIDMIGSFWSDEEKVVDAGVHHWVRFPNGDWLDPTSEQFGLPPALLIPQGDPIRKRYRGVVVQTDDTIDHILHDLREMGGMGIESRFLTPVYCTEEVHARLNQALEEGFKP